MLTHGAPPKMLLLSSFLALFKSCKVVLSDELAEEGEVPESSQAVLCLSFQTSSSTCG